MSEKKQKLELTWIGKEKWPRLGQVKSLEILAKVAAVGPMKKSGADEGAITERAARRGGWRVGRDGNGRRLYVDVPHHRRHGGDFGIICNQ